MGGGSKGGMFMDSMGFFALFPKILQGYFLHYIEYWDWHNKKLFLKFKNLKFNIKSSQQFSFPNLKKNTVYADILLNNYQEIYFSWPISNMYMNNRIFIKEEEYPIKCK